MILVRETHPARAILHAFDVGPIFNRAPVPLDNRFADDEDSAREWSAIAAHQSVLDALHRADPPDHTHEWRVRWQVEFPS